MVNKLHKDGQMATVMIALPARVTWSLPVLDRVDDILETFDSAGVTVSDRTMAGRILAAAVRADRNTAEVHLRPIVEADHSVWSSVLYEEPQPIT